MDAPDARRPPSAWPPGAGEMAARIRDHDWTATPLGPISTWPRSLKPLVELMLAMPHPAVLTWGPELSSLYNDGFVAIVGTKHPTALGQPYRVLWEDVWDQLAPVVEATLAGRAEAVADQPLPLPGRPGRPLSWLSGSWTPVRDDAGSIAGFFCVATETTERVLADAALRASEAQFDALTAAIADVFYVTDLERGRLEYLSPAYERIWGRPAAGMLENLDAFPLTIHPEDRAAFAAGKAGQARGDSITMEYRIIRPDGTVRWIRDRAFPVAGATGKRSAGVASDVTAEKAAEGRRRYLLQLNDALQPLADPVAINAVAARLLGEHLGVNRVLYAVATADHWRVVKGYEQGVEPLAEQRHPMLAYGQWIIEDFAAARPLVVRDVDTDDRFQPSERAALAALQISGVAAVPLVKNGVLVAMLAVHTAAPHDWTDQELALIGATAERTWDAAERAVAEAALQASEERQTFLLHLSDELRPLADPVAIQETAARVLGEQLGASRIGYAEDAGDGRHVTVTQHFTDGVAGIEGRYRYDDYGAALLRALRAGKTVVRPDIAGDPTLTATEKRAHAVLGVAACVNIPLIKDDRLDAIFFIHQQAPRAWSATEVALMEDTAERIWAAVARARTEAALRASEAQFRAVANLVPDLLWQSTPDGTTDWYNDRWPAFTGQTPERIAGWGWMKVVHPDDHARSATNTAAAIASGQPLTQEIRIRDTAGTYRWFLVRAEPQRDERGAVMRWFGAATDIHEERTARDELAARVAEATAELRVLSRRLLMVQEEERRHLARELHDEIGQVLTGLTFQLTAAGGAGDGTALTEAVATVQALTDQVRQLSMDLRPQTLDQFGLGTALRTLVRTLEQRTGLAVELSVDGLEAARLDPDLEITAYRIVQEALTNVVRHAGTLRATVRLWRVDGEIALLIRDAGQGFHEETLGRSNGLRSMRERTELLGGVLTVQSAPGQGTIISVVLPVDGASA